MIRTIQKSIVSTSQSRYQLILAVVVLLTSFHTPALGQDLVISEFVATNASGLKDEEGEFNDWIEIFNPTEHPISLDGWRLTDDPGNPAKWKFPALNIQPNRFLLVFASGKDRTDPSTNLHTNFKLSTQGEYLALIRPDGMTISSEYAPKYPAQFTDTSYGLAMESEVRILVPSNGSARILVPTDNSLANNWTQRDFKDDQWSVVDTGIGFLQVEQETDENQSNVAKTLTDLTQPSDLIKPTSSNSPGGETVKKAIDNDPQTKYLNRDKLNAGFTIRPVIKGVPIIGIRFTSANDSPDRDPTSFVLSGSNNDINFSEIAKGSIPDFTQRFENVRVAFPNVSIFNSYRLIFPTVRNVDSAVAVQIAEVELLALIAIGDTDPNTNSGPDVSSLVDISEPNDLTEPTSFNSPSSEGVENAIDNNPKTKYLNRDILNAGFTVYPANGETVVSGLRFTSANDAPDRDPTSFILSGSNDDKNFTEISRGSILRIAERFESVEVSFSNSSSFTSYHLIFPDINGSGCCMQIAEVEFLGTVGPPVVAFEELITTSIEDLMVGKSASLYLRIPFTVETMPFLDQLELSLRYDDGFVAYLNGIEVARSNAPPETIFNSTAITDRPSAEVSLPVRINLNEYSHLIHPGENILAIHGLNDSIDGNDFLIQIELINSQLEIVKRGYFEQPTPGTSNGDIQIEIVNDLSFSTGRGFFDVPLEVSITSTTPETEIRYSTDGSHPTEETGLKYTVPIRIAKTTVLRAAAYREGWRSSPAETHTYLFPDDVITQTTATTLASGFPSTWRSDPADYGLDPKVIGLNRRDNYRGKYAQTIREDLQTLPSISIVMEIDDLFGPRGIYSNATSRGALWERPTSVELIFPDNRKGFQEEAGIRVQGGAFRSYGLTHKKSLRLIFKKKYGAATLNYPLFGPEAVDQFDTLILRGNSNDGWPRGGGNALYIRDAFAMETARAMGMVASHTSFAHLYLNGVYWGLYNLVERPDAAFSASYHGGDKDTWDAINQDSVPDGNYDAWNRMLSVLNEGLDNNEVYQRIQGNNPDGTRNPDYEDLLDMENMIDYMILNFYVGNGDWPGRNHWEGRDRNDGDGFQFYPWDTETALSNVNSNRLGASNAVAMPFAAARVNADFRMLFADRVHKHFFNGGALYVNPDDSGWDPTHPENNRAATRFSALADSIDRAMVAESARWGDQTRTKPFTRDEHWEPARDNLLKNYFPKRSAIVLNQFRNAGLYPRTVAPSFNQQGGKVAKGFTVKLAAPVGTIYFTTDGSDPRAPVEVNQLSQFKLVPKNTSRRVLTPSVQNGGSQLGEEWRNPKLGFNDSQWASGSGGVGYDTGSNYRALIKIDVSRSMRGKNGSVFIRIPFDYDQTEHHLPNYMTLSMRFDDGFIAYLNGTPMASANAPATPQWNSFATVQNEDPSAVIFQAFDVSQSLHLLRQGNNLLAIHGLNISNNSSDFLIDSELTIGKRCVSGVQDGTQLYTGPIQIQDLTIIKSRALNGSEWSALNEATFTVGEMALVLTEMHYHPISPSEAERNAGFNNADD